MRLRFRHPLAAALASLTLAVPAAADEAPGVVASIKPVHSLVAGVMEGVGEPHLLVAGGDSPHTYAMRPSDAEALSGADVVFWIGSEFEVFLERPIANLGDETRSVPLIRAPGIVLFDYAGLDEDHGDGHGHEHHDQDGHAHDDHSHADHAHDEHEHDHAREEGHGGDGHHDHAHIGTDGHVWLDPANARAMVADIVDTLVEVDSAHADAYRANGERLTARLDALEADVSARLEPYRDVPYFTFHDSFRYFAERFDLNSRGAITVSPEIQPGAQRLEEIRDEIAGDERLCIFAEPQFPPRLVDVIIEGTQARTGVVDPIGADIAEGPGLYFDLIGFNADAFEGCFASTM